MFFLSQKAHILCTLWKVSCVHCVAVTIGAYHMGGGVTYSPFCSVASRMVGGASSVMFPVCEDHIFYVGKSIDSMSHRC